MVFLLKDRVIIWWLCLLCGRLHIAVDWIVFWDPWRCTQLAKRLILPMPIRCLGCRLGTRMALAVARRHLVGRVCSMDGTEHEWAGAAVGKALLIFYIFVLHCLCFANVPVIDHLLINENWLPAFKKKIFDWNLSWDQLKIDARMTQNDQQKYLMFISNWNDLVYLCGLALNSIHVYICVKLRLAIHQVLLVSQLLSCRIINLKRRYISGL